MKKYTIYFEGKAQVEAENKEEAFSSFANDNPGWDVDITEIEGDE